MFEIVPFQTSDSLQKMRRDMDESFSRFFSKPLAVAGVPAFEFVPAINIKETEKAFEISVEVAGMKPEEIETTLTGDVLTIKGEKKKEKEETKGDYHLTERGFGSFSRSFRLPSQVERDKLKAKCEDGVLNLTLPKSANEKVTKIQIS